VVALRGPTARGALVLACADGCLSLADPRSGHRLEHSLPAHSGGFAALDAGGDLVATSGYSSRLGRLALDPFAKASWAVHTLFPQGAMVAHTLFPRGGKAARAGNHMPGLCRSRRQGSLLGGGGTALRAADGRRCSAHLRSGGAVRQGMPTFAPHTRAVHPHAPPPRRCLTCAWHRGC
jgi:hypothetical protein